MFDDIIVCEVYHTDKHCNERCNPRFIQLGTAEDNGILVTMTFCSDTIRQIDVPIEIEVDILTDNEHEFKDKYDIDTGVVVYITDHTEYYVLLIGSNGKTSPYFTNKPAINNTTEFGDTIFLNFPHAVEGFSFKGTPKLFN